MTENGGKKRGVRKITILAKSYVSYPYKLTKKLIFGGFVPLRRFVIEYGVKGMSGLF